MTELGEHLRSCRAGPGEEECLSATTSAWRSRPAG